MSSCKTKTAKNASLMGKFHFISLEKSAREIPPVTAITLSMSDISGGPIFSSRSFCRDIQVSSNPTGKK